MEKKRLALLGFAVCAFVRLPLAQNVTIENPKAKVIIALDGGRTTSFSLKSQNINPFHTLGHFVCFDRWGPSSPQDLARGIPQHGEASITKWTLDKAPLQEANDYRAELSCLLPIVKLKIDRVIRFDKNEAVYQVTDKISNPNAVRQIFNLVQHVTLGAPFLDSTTIVDTKVDKGFWQSGVIPPTGSAILGWPQVNLGGKVLNLQYQHPKDNPADYVVSYALPQTDTYGWVTAINKAKKLLIGYVWPIAESPWINFWSNTSQVARGLEFGTGGLHQPFPAVIQTGPIFSRPLCQYVAPDSPITKTFTAFLAEIPVDFKGVSLVVYQPDKITISETGGDVSRNIVIPMGMNPTAALPRQNVPKETIARVTVSGEAGKTGRITIRYFLVASQRVCVELFSVNGEKVRDLFNGIQIRGTHSLIASVGEIPKGMYLCRMKIGNNEIVSEVVTLVR
jgi:hypothetical protein